MAIAQGAARTLLDALRPVRGARAMLVTSVLGRLGYAMVNVAVLLFVQGMTGSFGAAGAVSAASLVGTAGGTVAQGRAIDRWGPSRVLLVVVPVHVVLGTAAVVAIAGRAPVAVMAVAAAGQCAALPAVAVASRAMWPHLLPTGPAREAAYTYEAVSFEACWLLGPAASAILATSWWPGSGLVVSLVVVTVGATTFALVPAVRSHRGRAAADAAPEDGPDAAATQERGMRPAGLVVLLAAATGFGFAIGCAVVGVTAGTAAFGVPRLAGVLLVLWSVASILGGLLYQRRPWPEVVAHRPAPLLAALGVVLALPALTVWGAWGLALAMALAGLTLVPQVTAHNRLLDDLVPPRRLSEAYGWLTTAVVVANAAGQALAGGLVDVADHRAAYLLATVTAVPVAVVVWRARSAMDTPAALSSRRRPG